MPFAIFALAAVNIAIGTQTFVFAGLLNELAGDLGVSLGTAGLLVPAASITFALSAPFATALVSRFERKRVVQLCQIAEAATALFLAVSTYAGSLTELQIFIATFLIGMISTRLVWRGGR